MAYAAAVSLVDTIQRLVHNHRNSIHSASRRILELAQEEVKSLQEVLKRVDKNRTSSERMKALEGEMREALCLLEDVIESHVLDQFLALSETLSGDGRHQMLVFLDLQELWQHIEFFIERKKPMEAEYVEELDNLILPEEDHDVVSSRRDFSGNMSNMVGLADEFCEMRDHLVNLRETIVLPIVGMAGIGKTTLAEKIFADPLIMRNFECRAFVRLGQNYQSGEILAEIGAQLNPGNESLDGRRYLIVLDDVWDKNFWNEFTRKLPQEDNGNVILVTTRLEQIASSLDILHPFKVMRFLNKEESWDLFHVKVFSEESCSYQLEKAGKKIVEKCEGLPLMIITVASLLAETEKTPEYWNEVAENEKNSVFMDAYDQISEILYRSYHYLPQHLKACFLYMGVFPQNHKVRPSRLINLWGAEGFLEIYPHQNLPSFVEKCFWELVSSNVVVVGRFRRRVKSCHLHSVYWHLCEREVGNTKFLHILNKYADGFVQGIESRRRLSIYKNVLFGIQDVYNSLASVSTARSILCTGSHHPYPVPIAFDMKLLRVLDALTIRFYEFPMEVSKLIQLRYLAFTYDGSLSPSISQLWNLQYLIVYQHLDIQSSVEESYLPVEIWDLKELKHLEIMGRNLPDPPSGSALPNLLTLLDVDIRSCTRSVLRSFVYLEKLRVRIEMGPDDEPFTSYFHHISHLYALKSLQLVVVSPEVSSQIVAQPPPFQDFASRLRKLTLSGCGYPWKDMSIIAELSCLEVLKIQCYAFQGENWESNDHEFQGLVHLTIEDTDLVHWIAGNNNFPKLFYLTIKNCYGLQDIPLIPSLFEIQLIDCNPSAQICAHQIKFPHCDISAYSSWDDGNLKPYTQIAAS